MADAHVMAPSLRVSEVAARLLDARRRRRLMADERRSPRHVGGVGRHRDGGRPPPGDVAGARATAHNLAESDAAYLELAIR
jgi:hypothetical protein